MAIHLRKARYRLVLNTFLSFFPAQFATLSAWMLYLLAAFMLEGKHLRTLPVFPLWLLGVAVIACLVAVGVNVYQYRQGLYDEENPLLKSRQTFRREMIARHHKHRQGRGRRLVADPGAAKG